jgi:hypothetical protein
MSSERWSCDLDLEKGGGSVIHMFYTKTGIVANFNHSELFSPISIVSGLTLFEPPCAN